MINYEYYVILELRNYFRNVMLPHPKIIYWNDILYSQSLLQSRLKFGFSRLFLILLVKMMIRSYIYIAVGILISYTNLWAVKQSSRQKLMALYLRKAKVKEGKEIRYILGVLALVVPFCGRASCVDCPESGSFIRDHRLAPALPKYILY